MSDTDVVPSRKELSLGEEKYADPTVRTKGG